MPHPVNALEHCVVPHSGFAAPSPALSADGCRGAALRCEERGQLVWCRGPKPPASPLRCHCGRGCAAWRADVRPPKPALGQHGLCPGTGSPRPRRCREKYRRRRGRGRGRRGRSGRAGSGRQSRHLGLAPGPQLRADADGHGGPLPPVEGRHAALTACRRRAEQLVLPRERCAVGVGHGALLDAGPRTIEAHRCRTGRCDQFFLREHPPMGRGCRTGICQGG